ncbi:hypothetical protein M3610_10410 [Neobacillus sp. MER 74]|uniref:hypothetical protein n=1 Tax=Neobacillus sp. MER 74 TaxID=2939566 RepID=UPI00203F9CB7|nr:hypothetical protein [Neobacillus sp. MER 74]MCM3115700.1 hypothetical protein [Neobacillus sp. MER 74]
MKKLKVFGDGPPFEGTPKQIRRYVEDLFEEDFGFKIYLQEYVDNFEFHLLLRIANKSWLNDEQQRVIDSIYCYLTNPANQS